MDVALKLGAVLTLVCCKTIPVSAAEDFEFTFVTVGSLVYNNKNKPVERIELAIAMCFTCRNIMLD